MITLIQSCVGKIVLLRQKLRHSFLLIKIVKTIRFLLSVSVLDSAMWLQVKTEKNYRREKHFPQGFALQYACLVCILLKPKLLSGLNIS